MSIVCACLYGQEKMQLEEVLQKRPLHGYKAGLEKSAGRLSPNPNVQNGKHLHIFRSDRTRKGCTCCEQEQ